MDSKGRIQIVKKGKTGKVRQGYSQSATVFGVEGISPTIDSAHSGSRHFAVFGQTTTTSTRAKSTEDIGMTEHSMKATSEQLTLIPYQVTISSVRDFLARISALLEDGQESKELEAHCSLRYAESYKLRDLIMCSLKTSKGYSLPTMEEHLASSWLAWMNWGMTVNGKCLTARISECHRTEKGCSLSDILEDSPDPKYFLSEKQIMAISKWKAQQNPLLELLKREELENTMQECN